MANLFCKTHPKNRYIYAVTTGHYAGELLVYIQTNTDHEFLSLPKMCNRKIPKDKFELGIKEKIVDSVSKIPRYVYTVCKKQYEKNETSENIKV